MGVLMKSKKEKPLRLFKDVSSAELQKAVFELVEKLNVQGSGCGYSLYASIFKEHQKAKEAAARGYAIGSDYTY